MFRWILKRHNNSLACNSIVFFYLQHPHSWGHEYESTSIISILLSSMILC